MTAAELALRLEDALEVGDVDLLVALVQGVAEDGPTEQPVPCPECQERFRWPGERDHHLLFAHPESA